MLSHSSSNASVSTFGVQAPIFVAATKQHTGKTTVSLALMSGLRKRFREQGVGFIKPVGQQSITVANADTEAAIEVDKDVVVMKEHFRLDHLNYRDMSPVMIPRGYTRDYIKGKIKHADQVDKITSSFNRIACKSELVLCEGTGHCAVGSIVDLNNAQVARHLGAHVVLVANGGLGSTFDDLELNRILCLYHQVPIAGVILNKVKRDKYDQTREYISLALSQSWGNVPLLGCIPDRPFLGCAALADLETLFTSKLLCGQIYRMKHYSMDGKFQATILYLRFLAPLDYPNELPSLFPFALDIKIVQPINIHRFREELKSNARRTMYICHSTSSEIIMAFIEGFEHHVSTEDEPSRPFESALIICGKTPISTQVNERLQSTVKKCDSHKTPAILKVSNYSTVDALGMIQELTPKLNADDCNRVTKAIEHYEPFINFDLLLSRTRRDTSLDFYSCASGIDAQINATMKSVKEQF